MIDTILFAIVLTLQLGDGISTVLCLRYDGLSEGNPAARHLMGSFGVVTASVILKVAAALLALAVLLLAPFNGTRTAILAVAAVMFAWATGSNVRLLIKKRHASDRGA
ncbi:DUF5658 family protein [Sphingomonas sp. NFR15]|uniref:DUF5658 family protein n=1 Tax=Sphingomonas sp. NFR15 TaxID=1566282 RepID=UPI00089067EE|nr:DUF5658 family protein [Sphingomonas sp. NFR15]SDA21763.1 hypothetical protein SAMN03159340_01493 [Sphingomonas sp. NFR15]